MLKLLERKEGNQCYKFQDLIGSSIKLAFTSSNDYDSNHWL